MAVTDRRARRVTVLLALAVAALAFAAYVGTLSAGFQDWDDDNNFARNPYYRGLGGAQLTWMAAPTGRHFWGPLTWLTLSLDWLVWGLNPRGYHLTNVLLHAATAAAVFLLARRLLARAVAEVTPSVTAVAGAVAALFWALHPLRAESVAWISERRDVLSGLLLVLAVLAWLRSTETAPRRRWTLAALAIYALSMLAKPIGMTLPVVLLILDVYPLRRLTPGRGMLADPAARAVLWEKAAYVVIGFAGAIPAVAFTPDFTSAADYPLWVRPLVFGYGLAFYVWKTLWPLGLIALYEIPVRWTPLEWRFVIGSVAALAITAGVLVARRSWPAPLAAWAAAVVLVSPVSGLLVHNGPQIAADRYTYLPAIPLSLLVGGGVCLLARAVARGTVALGNARMITVGLAIWLLGFGALTWQQAEVWQDSVSMWSHAVTFAPNCARCQHGLGSALHNHGAPHVALPHFQRAVALRPDMVDFRIPLGISLLEAGRGAEALPHLEKAVAHFDKNPKLHRHLGAALLSAGRPDDARREFEAALAVRADDRDALTGVGLALVDANRPGDSLPFFEKALAGSTPAPYAHFGLARAYLALGDSGRAEREIAVLRTLDPRLAARAAKR